MTSGQLITTSLAPAAVTIRPTGVGERMFIREERFARANCAMVFDVDGGLTPALLRRAIDVMQREDAALRLRLVDGQFVPIDAPIPLTVLPAGLGHTPHSALEAVMNEDIAGADAPLCRVVLLLGDTPDHASVVFGFHHSIADGRSYNPLAHRLVRIADALLCDVPIPSRVVVDGVVTADGAWPDAVRGASGARLLWRFLRIAVTRALVWRPALLPRAKTTSTTAPSCRLRFAVQDGEAWRAFCARARAEQASVHAALGAVLLLGLRDALRARDTPLRNLSLCTAVDVRSVMRVPATERLSMFVSAAITTHDVTDDDVWALARACKTELAASLAAHEPSWSLRLIHIVRALPRALVRALATPSVMLSNLGALPPGPSFERLRFSQPFYAAPPVTNTANSLNVAVGAHEGAARFVFSLDPRALDENAFHAACDAALAWITRACDTRAPLEPKR